MSNRYWGGRPKARQANVMLILAGALVGVVLGFGLGTFVDIDLQERLLGSPSVLQHWLSG